MFMVCYLSNFLISNVIFLDYIYMCINIYIYDICCLLESYLEWSLKLE